MDEVKVALDLLTSPIWEPWGQFSKRHPLNSEVRVIISVCVRIFSPTSLQRLGT